jgi:hypothetical protein|tara:strand:+ start:637 stop:939 length:303 start_codon:yes stop_codon:yes gene_type:complete
MADFIPLLLAVLGAIATVVVPGAMWVGRIAARVDRQEKLHSPANAIAEAREMATLVADLKTAFQDINNLGQRLDQSNEKHQQAHRDIYAKIETLNRMPRS